jgi:acyl-CoA thioester hydrolase
MENTRFFHPVEVRYADLDPQGHLNNAKYLSYFEQARVQYMVELGLFGKDQSFMEIGLIIADIHIGYEAPVHWGDPVKVGVRTVSIGNKSITMEHVLVNSESGELLSKATIIAVGFDYAAKKTIPIPADWREKIGRYEGANVQS